MARIRTYQHPDEPTPPHLFDDLAWASANLLSLLETYGEGWALIYHKEVIGFGKTMDEAIRQAEAHTAAITGEIIPAVRGLSAPYRLYRVEPHDDD